MNAIFLLALASSASALVARHEVSKKNPVTAIVTILKDMGKELETDLKEDKKVHEELGCWCKSGLKDLQAQVEVTPPKIERYKATMGTNSAKVTEAKESLKSLDAGLRSDNSALGKATSIRMNENKAFRKSRNELSGSISSLERALLHMDGKASLAQMQTTARDLLNSRVSEVALAELPGLSKHTINELDSYLNRAAGASSFLATSGPQSYAPQGGQIRGILSNMQDEFKKNLAALEAAETKAQAEYDSLQSAKQDQINTAKKAVVATKADSAAFQEKYEHAAKALKSAEATLAADTVDLVKMTKTCSGSEAEFEQRVKDRMTEIQAVAETITILNNDSSRDAFAKAPAASLAQEPASYMSQLSFLQVSSQTRKHALSLIQKLVSTSASPELSLLAVLAKSGKFGEITAHIDKLVAALKVEQTEEEGHKTWCGQEKFENQGDLNKATDQQSNLNSKIASVKSEIKATSAELASSVAEVAKMNEQLAAAAKLRSESQAELQKTVQDNTVMVEILRSAIARMEKVYAFMQQEGGEEGAPHTQLSGGPPSRFRNNSSNNRGGGTVVNMLQGLLKSTNKTIQDAKSAEANQQVAFETTKEDIQIRLNLQNEPQNDAKSEIATDSEDLSAKKADLSAADAKVENVHGRIATTKKSCDYIVTNFDQRAADRTAQVDNLTELKAVLAAR